MSEIATWSGAGLGIQIDYSREVLENIRRKAIQGPADSLCGILLGEREAKRIVILDSLELPEPAQARDVIAKVEASRVIGWYCSKGLRPLELTDSDRAMLGALFPEPSHPWHIGLLVQPRKVLPTRIAFLCPGSNGELQQGEPGELAEWPAGPEWVTQIAESRDSMAHDPVVTIRARNGSRWIRHEDPFAVLAVDAAEREGSRRKRLTWMLAAATVIVAGVVGLVLSRFWMPSPPLPPLVLDSSEVDGTLVLRWNDDAVKGIDHAEIFITDGDRGRVVPLDRSQLSAGELHYVRRSPRVTAAMTAGRQQAETSFAAPVPRRKRSPAAPKAP